LKPVISKEKLNLLVPSALRRKCLTNKSLNPCTPAHLNSCEDVVAAYPSTVAKPALSGFQMQKRVEEHTKIEGKCICTKSLGIEDILFTVGIGCSSNLRRFRRTSRRGVGMPYHVVGKAGHVSAVVGMHLLVM
jgi:hypothetical protein